MTPTSARGARSNLNQGSFVGHDVCFAARYGRHQTQHPPRHGTTCQRSEENLSKQIPGNSAAIWRGRIAHLVAYLAPEWLRTG